MRCPPRRRAAPAPPVAGRATGSLAPCGARAGFCERPGLRMQVVSHHVLPEPLDFQKKRYKFARSNYHAITRLGKRSLRPQQTTSSKQQTNGKQRSIIVSLTSLYRELTQVEKARVTKRIRGNAPRRFEEVTAGRTHVSMPLRPREHAPSPWLPRSEEKGCIA